MTRMSALRSYGLPVATLVAAAGLRPALGLGEDFPFIFFFPAVMLSAWAGGFGPGLFATLAGAAVAMFTVLPPVGSFAVESGRDVVGLAIYVAAGLQISALSGGLRRARDEAAREKESLAVTLRSIGDAVIATDPAGRVTLMNPVAEALTGWREAEARGRPLGETFVIIDQETRRPLEDPVAVALRERRPVALANHTALVARDGRERIIADTAAPIVDAVGALQGVVLVFRDMGDRERAEAARALIAETSAALVGSLDVDETLSRVARLLVPRLADGVIIDLKDRPREPVVAHRQPEGAELLRELRRRWAAPRDHGLTRVLETGQPQLLAEVTDDVRRAVAHDAEHLDLVRRIDARSALIVPLTLRQDRLGALTLLRVGPGAARYGPDDVPTALELGRRLAAAVDNARLYAQARAAVRLRDDFLSIASHELRTPLTPLSLQLGALRRMVERMEERPLTREGLVGRLDILERQVQRLSLMVEGLLDVSRLETGRLELRLEEVDLARVAADVVERLRPEAERAGTTLELHAPAPAPGRWDTLRVDQVVTNLVGNALKYGQGKPVAVHVASVDGTATLLVADRGIGIAPADQARIFGRYERAVSTESYGGFGLGLWITRSVVEALGGTIAVASTPGEGATFRVDLPVKGPPPRDQAASSGVDGDGTTRSTRP